jgi:hypothetical protein
MTTKLMAFFAEGTYFALLAETPTVETASAIPRPMAIFLKSPLFVEVSFI